MLQPSLHVTDLECRKGDVILFKGINFSLQTGEALQVTGQNGSGKTSLLKIICGLTQASNGHVYWNNKKINESDSFNSELCYVGHKTALKLNLTVRENLSYKASLQGIPSIDSNDILSQLNLSDLAHYYAHQLSAGQKQRLALTRLLICNAKLWVLDEPLTALDQKSIDSVKQLIQNHLHNNGIVVFTSHQFLHLSKKTNVLSLNNEVEF